MLLDQNMPPINCKSRKYFCRIFPRWILRLGPVLWPSTCEAISYPVAFRFFRFLVSRTIFQIFVFLALCILSTLNYIKRGVVLSWTSDTNGDCADGGVKGCAAIGHFRGH